MSITIKDDLASVSSVLKETFQTLPFKRDYDKALGQIGTILLKYGIQKNPRNLRFRFILCMQEFFEFVCVVSQKRLIELEDNKDRLYTIDKGLL